MNIRRFQFSRRAIGASWIALLALLAACAPLGADTPTPDFLPTDTSTPPKLTAPPVATPTLTPIPVTLTPAPTPTSPYPAGETRTDSKGIEQVWVPAGCFLMGSAGVPGTYASLSLREQPQHEVCLTQGYWIDKYEVTNAAFQAFIDDGGYLEQAHWSEQGWAWLGGKTVNGLPAKCVEDEAPTHPRVCITWYEAEAYARWRNGQLPTEAQWEYAARGPQSLTYPWGNKFDESKTNLSDSFGLKPVGSYPDGVSWVGAHDMAGNAMEWVQDWLDDNYYKLGLHDDPPGPETGTIKIEKGGWWGANRFFARSAYRHFEDPPGYQDHHIGVRIVSVQ